MDILVFGSIGMDLTTYMPSLPRLGETLFGSSYITVPGGKGFNQAVAASRLGAQTQFVGRVGDDQFGNQILDTVKEEKMDVSQILKDPGHDTCLAVISVDENADNSITVISGANMALDTSDLERADKVMDGVKVVMLQLEIPMGISVAAAKKAKEKGVIVVFDPAPAAELPEDAFQYMDVITPNEVETEALVDFYPKTQADAARAAKVLRDKGVGAAVIKMGALGVYFDGPKGSGFVPAFKVNAIDTVAAGDAFNAGLAVALAEGKPMPEAVRWGAAAGAIATTRKGALPAMPYRKELMALLG
jgi:ribokinase